MTDTFTWAPRNEATGHTALAVRKAQFGDGYSQAVVDGINPVSQSWPLTFVGTAATITAIEAFLDAHVGQSFFWTPPLRSQGYFECVAYDTQKNDALNVYTLSMTLQQVFRP